VFNTLIASGKTKAPRPVGGVVVSMLVHGSLVTALLFGSRPAIRAATEFEERIAEYLFPQDRAPKIGDEGLTYLRVPGGLTGSSASVGGSGSATGRSATKSPDPSQSSRRWPNPWAHSHCWTWTALPSVIREAPPRRIPRT
jgi:hypothetical protein